MDIKVKRELIIFLPLFAVIVLIAIGLGFVMPEQIPENIGITGVATAWTEKSYIHYHIPAPELIVYVFLTFLQFHYMKKNDSLSEFLFMSKLGIIIFCGTMIPLSTYAYSMKYISNIWYIVGPVVSALVMYLFVVALITGVLNKTRTVKGKHMLPKTRNKYKKKKKTRR